ncbi:PD-(D/E)XK nuclease family protein, partial [Candidatus Margulisiibacteriota bacterium]
MRSSELFIYTQQFKLLQKQNQDLHKHVYWKMLFDAAQKTPDKIVIIVSTKTQKHWILKQISQYLRGKALIPEVISLEELLLRSYNPIFSNESILNELYLDEVLQEINLRGMYRDIRKKEGIKNHFFKFINNIQKHNISINKHKKYLDKLHIFDLVSLFIKKKNNSPFDISSLLQAAKENKFTAIKQYLGDRTLFLFGFIDLNNSEKNVIQSILKNAPISSLLLSFKADNEIYEAARGLYEWLRQLPIKIREIRVPHIPITRKKNKEAASKLFSQVKTYKFQNMTDEVKYIAKEIVGLIENDITIKPNEIVIVAPSQKYYDLIEKTLDDYHISFMSGYPKKLNTSTISVFLQNLLSLVNTDFEISSLLDFVKAPFVHKIIDIRNTDHKYTFHLELLEKILFRFKSQEGFNVCLDALKGFQKDLENKYKIAEQDPDILDKLTKQITEANDQIKALQALYILVDRLKKSSDIQAFVQNLKQIFLSFEIYEQIQSAVMAADKDIQHKIFDLNHAYLALMEFLDEFADSMLLMQREIEITTIISLLKKTLKKQGYQSPVSFQEGVQVVRKTEAFQLNPKILFLPGLIEGQWACPEEENIFINKKTRKKGGFPLTWDNIEKEKYLFFSLINHSDCKCFISYPEVFGGQPTLPGNFILLLAQILKKELGFSPPEEEPYINFKEYLLSLQEFQEEEIKDYSLKIRDIADKRSQKEKGFNSYSGYLKRGATLKKLKKKIQENTFSAAQLETYQKCPYQYFYKYILKEEKLERIEEEISAKVWGVLVHEIFYFFNDQFKNKGLDFHEIEHKTEAKKLLAGAAKRVFSKYGQDNYFWHIKKELFFGNKSKPGILDLFIDKEFTDKSPLKPAMFEKAFCEKIQRDAKETIKIKGSIDVILMTPDKKYYGILDYKTGSNVPTPSEVKNFSNLQIPIYQLVASKLIHDKVFAG